MKTEFLFLLVGLLTMSPLILLFPRKKRLPRATAAKAIQEITATEKLNSAHAIIEAHKIFIFTLATLISQEKRKRIKSIDIVKKFVKRMPNEAQIWKTHRLRNRIAHEPNVKISTTHANLARRDLIRAIQSLSKK